MDRKITKVKFDKGEITICYLEKNQAGGDNELTLKSFEPPAMTFLPALSALAPFVADIVEFNGDAELIVVSSVDIDYNSLGERGVVFRAKKKLLGSGVYIDLKTPLKKENNSISGLSFACVVALDRLVEQAVNYLNGERAQAKLFDDLGKSLDATLNPGDGIRAKFVS